jgi:2,3-bisphosphoglycerate-dependent phosphoglycerate mutase
VRVNKGRRIAAIIRHGEYYQMPGAPSAHQPYPLNADGENHAREAADTIGRFLQQYHCDIVPEIDCSQMLRGWQTADIIAGSLAEKLTQQLRLESFDELAERSVGCAANLTADAIQKIIHNDPRYQDLPEDWKSNSEYCLPLQGAESLLDAGERVAGHLLQRMSELPDEAVDRLKLFVGHGAAFRHAAYHLGVLEYEQIKRLSMYHGRPVFLELLDDGSWLHIEGEWKPRSENSQYKD